MKKILIAATILILSTTASYAECGLASFYSTKTDGTRTASGIPLVDSKLTAAHKTRPLRSKVLVRGNNGRSVEVTITDRGPFVRGRIIDLSLAAASAIGLTPSRGVMGVCID